MSILSRLTYFLEVRLNIFLLAFEFERHFEDPELQVDALPKTSSAKMTTRNRAAIGHLIDTQKFVGSWSFLLEDTGISVRDIKDVGTSTRKFSSHVVAHSMANSELAAHLKESLSNI